MMMLCVCFNINAQQLEELSQLLEGTELGELTRDKNEPVLKEEDVSTVTVDPQKIKTMSDLKQERINQMIQREIDQIEKPAITQRPDSLEIKPRQSLMDPDAAIKCAGPVSFDIAPIAFFDI